VAAVEEGRVGGDREQLRHHEPQTVAHPHRPLRTAHADVHVQAERVVPPRDVLEEVLDAPVVVGVDDLLLLPGAPGVRAGGGEQRVRPPGEREQARARVALPRDRVGEALAAAGADLDLGADQLARDGLGQHRVLLRETAQLLEAVVEGQRPWVEDGELLLEPDREVR
jgi:hypothetical protein